MNKTVVLAFAGGLLGGLASPYLTCFLTPQLVRAQSQALPPREIRAASFVLVNEKGTVLGTLADDAGRPALRLFDERGHEIWSAGGKTAPRTTNVGR